MLSWDVSDTVFPETLCVAASFAVLLPAAQETAQQRLFQQHLNNKHESVCLNKPSSLSVDIMLQYVMGFFKSLTSFAALLGTNPAVLRPESETKKNKTR